MHQQFWDGVNFSRGANPPRKAWRPPQQRTPEETEAAYQRFGEYVDHLRTIPGVRFITASDLPSIYPDTVRTEGASEADLAEIARRILARDVTGVDFQSIGKKTFSVADQFELLTRAVSAQTDGRKPGYPLQARSLSGQESVPPGTAGDIHAPWSAFREAVADADQFMKTRQRIPSRLFIGADPVAPADFLVALAFAFDSHLKNQALPAGDEIPFGVNTTVSTARHVAEDTPNLFGGWVIHNTGFRAPKILEIARLQAWTLKPAVRIY